MSLSNSKFKPFGAVGEGVPRIHTVPGGSLLTYWLFGGFGIDLPTILESLSLFSLALLPPFYKAVFDAWRSLGGSCDASSGAPT